MTDHKNLAAPHGWARKGWRLWLCRHCYAPKALHPRTGWVVARHAHINTYLGADAPHFKEGW
ncbi:hypothetical protein [Streptomyces sp. NPDC046925]|uniref:hypothetical protein n=1 Tax=Streptomyces sp. NPDC046925 TaxID=3155375 RepID=UPI0033D01A90